MCKFLAYFFKDFTLHFVNNSKKKNSQLMLSQGDRESTPEKPIVHGETATTLKSLFFLLGKSNTFVKQM
jgi:hypothetical protein